LTVHGPGMLLQAPCALVADIGGTNVRFGLARFDTDLVHIEQTQRYRCAEFATADDAIAAYLEQCEAIRATARDHRAAVRAPHR
jgi:glucokinase